VLHLRTVFDPKRCLDHRGSGSHNNAVPHWTLTRSSQSTVPLLGHNLSRSPASAPTRLQAAILQDMTADAPPRSYRSRSAAPLLVTTGRAGRTSQVDRTRVYEKQPHGGWAASPCGGYFCSSYKMISGCCGTHGCDAGRCFEYLLLPRMPEGLLPRQNSPKFT
jgi:hypothetical protein